MLAMTITSLVPTYHVDAKRQRARSNDHTKIATSEQHLANLSVFSVETGTSEDVSYCVILCNVVRISYW
jgi:hypothetical protein